MFIGNMRLRVPPTEMMSHRDAKVRSLAARITNGEIVRAEVVFKTLREALVGVRDGLC